MPLYRAFGLTIDSSLPLAGLAQGDAAPDIVVTHGRAEPGQAFADKDIVRGDAQTLVVDLEGIRYRIEEGRRIAILAPPDCANDVVAGWLTGIAFGVVLVQRGLLPLHANAVRLASGGVAAFVGPSGAGKSTLAAQLADTGLDLLTDDLLGIEWSDTGPLARRGISRIKLWSETLDFLGRDPADLERVVTRADKYMLSLAPGEEGPFPLERLYLLDPCDEDEDPAIEPVSGAEAARLVIDNCYALRAARLWHGGDDWLLQRSLDLVGRCEVYRFARPWTLERAEESLALLLDHLER